VGEGDEEQIAAVVSFVMAESSAMATQLGKENLSGIFVEFKERALISVPLNDQLFLVIIASASANIAQISNEMKKNRETILSHL
jgi:predicted regulator of Ras-like GTPase activity (Roadblock/LC7/MglB family)